MFEIPCYPEVYIYDTYVRRQLYVKTSNSRLQVLLKRKRKKREIELERRKEGERVQKIVKVEIA